VESAPILFKIFGLPVDGHITTMWGVTVVLLVVCLFASSNLKKVPGRFQSLVEYAVEGMMKYFESMVGQDKIRRYFPLIMTLFLFILFSNWSGILPLAGHLNGFRPPNTTWGITAALAVIASISAQVAGIREKGWGYAKHFLQPAFFMLPLNIIEELVRPLSLSIRLFGNMFGEETVAATLFSMAPFLVPIPIQILGILFGFIQALVFTTLTAIFIGQAIAETH
jgi:F-type H+-transporting ATPase subunit a